MSQTVTVTDTWTVEEDGLTYGSVDHREVLEDVLDDARVEHDLCSNINTTWTHTLQRKPHEQ